MGNTFMNMHICSTDKVDNSMMLEVFKAFKLNRGFVQCTEDEASLSYLVSYSESDVCSWLSISGTHWQANPFDATSDFLGMAREFSTPCIRINADSGGSALIELSDPFGNSAGAQIVGDAVPGEYFCTDMKETVWQDFLNLFGAEEIFQAVLNSPYHSSDETVATLAPLLHIRKEQLLLDAKCGIQYENPVRLYFKAISTDMKKITVKAAFKKIYGDALKPLGFILAKTKEPCFIRVVNDELIHIIGIHDMKPNFIVPFGGIATLYRADLGLDNTYQYMSSWLPSAGQFWLNLHTASDEAPDPRLRAKFNYFLQSPDSVENTVHATLNAVQRWVLPLLDTVKSLQEFPSYYKRCFGTLLKFTPLPLCKNSSDTIVHYLLDNPAASFERLLVEADERYNAKEAEYPEANIQENQKYLDERFRKRMETIRQSIHSFVEDPDVRQQTLKELECRRLANIELLHTYGVL